ncbi:MAG: GNAT family N-acetyltransferase [Acidobacteriota bacterium]|nr:GNAT family N-acetyltransferase [Acidobacteriota bacterium]
MEPFLTTQRLALFEMSVEDAPWMLRLLNEPSFLTNIGDRGVRSLGEAGRYLESRVTASYREHGFGMYRVEDREDGAVLGVCGLVRREGLAHADLGFAFFPEHWGRGYASEAGAAIVAHARNTLGLGTLLAIAAPDNRGSIRVLEKLGFERRGSIRLPGEEVDLELYGSGPSSSDESPGHRGDSPSMPLELTTDRLRLRQLQEDDLDAFAALNADPEVMRYIGAGRPRPRDEAWSAMARLLGHWQLRGYGMYAVEERSTGHLVGRLGLHRPEGWPGLEIGWLIARKSWGRGYAPEGAHAVLAQAFQRLDEPRIISLIHPANHASIRVAEKLGERLVGTEEVVGQEVLLYAVERGEWECVRTRCP